MGAVVCGASLEAVDVGRVLGASPPSETAMLCVIVCGACLGVVNTDVTGGSPPCTKKAISWHSDESRDREILGSRSDR